METRELLNKINQLSFNQKIEIVEKILHSIKQYENKIQMQEAAEALYTEYANNKELTAFSAIDLDDFYEAR